jgi:hypothetical protein
MSMVENHIYPSVDGLSVFLEIYLKEKSDENRKNQKCWALVENHQGIITIDEGFKGCV